MDEPQQTSVGHHSTREVIKGFVLGVLLVIVCTWLLAVILFALGRSGLLGIAGIWVISGFGVIQVIYMLPAVLIARRRDRRELAKGLIIAAALALLLNASCFALFWSGKLGRIGG